ncbi:MAG: hypothetical protein LUI09_08460 [Prevotellaceae bacterium]|nr:hypothetical protein [Prevotellaceae bacterium]
MRQYLKPSTETTETEFEQMLALSAVSTDPATHDPSNTDGDGLVKGGAWQSAGSIWGE